VSSFEEVCTIRIPSFFSLITNGEKTMTTPTSLLNDKFVDMAFITQLTGLTDKWFYKLISLGEFPKPIKLGRSSRWLESEVEAWLQQRITDSRG
jgi:predicted DNA-binding transcriptional regulator AlpA